MTFNWTLVSETESNLNNDTPGYGHDSIVSARRPDTGLIRVKCVLEISDSWSMIRAEIWTASGWVDLLYVFAEDPDVSFIHDSTLTRAAVIEKLQVILLEKVESFITA